MVKGTVYVFVLLFIWFYLPVTWTLKNITFGFFVPWTGRWAVGKQMASAALIARDAINKNYSILPGYHLDFVWKDSKCDAQESVGATADLHTIVDAYIGPYCSSGCGPAGLLAAHYGKPMITYGCSTKLLSNKKVYPTTARTMSYARSDPSRLLAKFSLLMYEFNWKVFSIIYDTSNSWQPVGHYFNTNVDRYGFKIQKYLPYNPDNLTTVSILKNCRSNARIILFLGYYSKVSQFLVSARKLNMFNGKYVFITVDFKTENSWLGKSWMRGNDLSVFSGFLDLSVQQPENTGDLYQNFSKDVRKRMGDPPFFHNMSKTEKVHKDSANLRDSIYVYALAYNKTLQQGKDPKNVTELMKNIFGIKFYGVSGEVLLNENGDRIPIIQLRSFQNGTPVYVYSYDPYSNNYTRFPKAAILWPGGVKVAPRDSPPCGFNNERCIDSNKPKSYTNEYMIAAVFLCSLFLLAGFLIYMYYKRKKFEKDMLCEGFFVNYDEIINHSVYHGKGGSMFASRMDCNYSVPSETESMLEKLQFVARYQGHQVVIKRLSGSTLHLNRDTLLDCKQARDVRHPNINTIIGVCVQSPNMCILTQYCQKGSLQDILQNEDIKLDWMFKLSLTSDIAIGMGELHRSPIGVHGRLNSSNCVIDNRWVCKITDYGLDKIRLNRKEEDVTEYQLHRRLLWVAPEHILDPEQKSKAGDVYSYGIILSEIMSRDDPYAELSLEPGEIVKMVTDRRIPPVRPSIGSGDCDVRYKKLMQDCWEDAPHARPKFDAVNSTIKRLQGGRQTNLVDNMISMLEKYANNLEDIVEERTQQLAAEKQKTDELLYKMLPKTIAEALKHGHEVTAVSYDSVTIFFSDIVGFTSLASKSSPLQVVDLLNDLYTCFDRIVDSHDVYKVETIGDAYMVVSGLPETNGNKHAGEISTMSLNFLHATKSFRVRHLPEKQLQLRIGIHTGSCVAGVVGLKMPRYCLFGDTVNYASRMESSGLALKIHVSPECKEVLDQLGGYKLSDRGPVAMKGKGTICTFFLEGKEGFNKSLPDLTLAASLAEHSFK